MRKSLLIGIIFALVFSSRSQGQSDAATPFSFVVGPTNSNTFFIVQGNKIVIPGSILYWGANWTWGGVPAATDKGVGGKLTFSEQVKSGQNSFTFSTQASAPSPQAVSYHYDLKSDQAFPITQFSVGLGLDANVAGDVVVTTADGKDHKISLPLQRQELSGKVSKLAFHYSGMGEISVSIDPPLPVQLELNNPRIELASGSFPQAASATITYNFPDKVTFSSSAGELASYVKTMADATWFPFGAKDFTSPSVIAMDDWLDAPAGKHGGVRMVGDHFQFEDGTPVKFWGTNLAYDASAPPKDVADAMAVRFARYGVNGLRLHKFSGAGWSGIGDANDCTKFDPAKLDLFDYFTSRVASHGIYFGFSHTFGFKVLPGNRDQLLAYDEIEKNLGGNTYALINYAEDVQDLMIKMVVNLLTHQNPYTGKTYAEDPALAYIELQNEDDIFFFTTTHAFDACPTYAQKLRERYAAWLKQRYGDQDGLKQAWGNALKHGETLANANIQLETNPWFFGPGLPAQGGDRRRRLDNAGFFHEVQNQFYGKFIAAIRATGYKGPIVGSPWQAPEMLPHYYNLRSDYLAGYIDRHDYFEGLFHSALANPGSGLLSSGLQQVEDRPFGLSEWIYNFPDVYGAEGPPLIAAYGMGLQGWDASYEFQSNPEKGLSPIAGGNFPRFWEVDTPTQMGQYPALARMILRGDVKESDVISTRFVSLKDLENGTLPFKETLKQTGDIKELSGSVPSAALAAGRCVVKFTQDTTPPVLPDMTKYQVGSVITSATGQLAWNSANQGFFTVNTAGTKGLVGFCLGKKQQLGGVAITSNSPFASIFITAVDRASTLENGKSALISAVAGQTNTGLTYFTVDNSIVNAGHGPILLQPVQADISFSGRNIAAVNVLDQNGIRSDKTLPVINGAFHIDTGRDKTIYYEVVFK